MQKLGVNALRKKFLDFFESKDHLILKSFPLVPINDKSMLLISAGMAPLKPYFSGQEVPPKTRIATCQKCVRVNDIENVGKVSRYNTFFEMLGNFSFGDYFKREALSWSWEFLTKVLEIPESLLFPSVYIEDDEAFDIWTKEIGLAPEKVIKLGKEDNFWEIEGGGGPCGPNSEIYFDRGADKGCGSDTCAPGCDCDRYIEVWNNVFTQFNSDGNGNYTPLEQKNIDTGMGLERLSMVMQGVNSLLEIDTFRAILDRSCEAAGVKYNTDEKKDISLRIIADHIRSATFMICDNILPSNEGRGYVLRRILRRAARHGKLLGIKGAFLYNLCDIVIELNEGAYPEVKEKQEYIKKILKAEEERFEITIDSGLGILENLIADTKTQGLKILAGEHIFKLYDTFGFPYDLTLEICEENGLELDKEGFDELMKEQRTRARKSRTSANIEGWSKSSESDSDGIATEFIGYDENTGFDCEILAIDIDGDICKIILDKTPFYAESGGQVGDKGHLLVNKYEPDSEDCEDKIIRVIDCRKTPDGKFIHICEAENIERFELEPGDLVTASICADGRAAIMRNHSAAHLLQAALREVLGKSVEQAGSYVDDERVRFDFTHYTAMTESEIAQVEEIVNLKILQGLDIATVETDIKTATAMGAIALFGEKYGDEVRVVKMGDFSCELCGGTHLDNTAKMGLFKILSESSVAAGVRRIEGTTGLGIFGIISKDKNLILDTAKALKINNTSDIAKKAEALQNELREQKREIESLNSRLAMQKIDDILGKIKNINGIDYAAVKYGDISPDAAKLMCDELRRRNENIAVAIATTQNDKLMFTVACGAEAVKKGANAGSMVKKMAQVTGGGGGGRADMASSGGKDISKLDEALASIFDV